MLDALLVLQADATPVPAPKLLALIGDRAAEGDVLEALDDLRQRALAWGDAALRVAPDAGTSLPWHPGQVTRGLLPLGRGDRNSGRRPR